MDKLCENEKLTLRKKWLSSLGKYGDDAAVPLHGTRSEDLTVSCPNKKPLAERKKSKAYKYDPEKENDTMALVASNPRTHHSTEENRVRVRVREENRKFNDQTSEKKHRGYKEKVMSCCPCNNKTKDRRNDNLEKSRPRSQETQDVYSNSFRSRDVTVVEHRPTSSGCAKKVDCGNFAEKKTRKTDGEEPDLHRKGSRQKKEENGREERNSDRSPRRTPAEQATKKKTNSLIGGAIFSCMKEGSSFNAEQVTTIGPQEKGRGSAVNKSTKHGDKADRHGFRRSTHATREKVELLNLSGDSSNKIIIMNNVENKLNEAREVLLNGHGRTVRLNNNSNKKHNNSNNDNADYYNKNNNANKRVVPDNNSTANRGGTSTSNTSTINSILTSTQTSKTSQNREKVGVNEKQNGTGCKGKKKAKTRRRRKRSKTARKTGPHSMCESQNTYLLSNVGPAFSLEDDNGSQKTRGTLQTSGGPKDLTMFHWRPTGCPTDNDQGYTVQEKKNSHLKPDQPSVGGKSESIEDLVITARSLITQCRKNARLFRNGVYNSEQSETMKFQPLKKNILMRESIKQNLDVMEDNWPLGYKSQDLYIPPKPENCFRNGFQIYSGKCLSDSPSSDRGKQDSDPDQEYSSINDADIDSGVSHERPKSPPSVTLVETSSSSSLATVGDCAHPRHPKKTLLDSFRRDARKSLRTEKISHEDQVITDSVPQQKYNRIRLEEEEREIVSAGISHGRLDNELPTRETLNQNRTLLTMPALCASIYEPAGAASPGQHPAHQHSNAESPFAFRLECIYDSDYQRIGYIHRRFPAISVPYIMIGPVEFVTVRGALKLFSGFDENGFIRFFLRDETHAMHKRACSRDQASLLRRINILPELEPTEGEELIQIGPLIYNFHRFKDVVRRLRFHKNHTALNPSHYCEH